MNEIPVTLTQQEASLICTVLAKSDPFAIYTIGLVKKIDAAARIAKVPIPQDRGAKPE